MTDKELHKLTRTELLEILYEQQTEIERLEKELADAKQLVESRKMLMHKAGSIAEASLKISEVFEAAQKAADRYLLSVKASCEHGYLKEETPDEVPETSETEPTVTTEQETAGEPEHSAEETRDSEPEAAEETGKTDEPEQETVNTEEPESGQDAEAPENTAPEDGEQHEEEK